MINHELLNTARLLVAAVQDANDFSADYLKRVIVHLVPQLLGEIEILGFLAERTLGQPDAAEVAKDLLASAAPATAKKKSKPKTKRKRRK